MAFKFVMLKIVVVSDRRSPNWSAQKITEKIVSNLTADGFAAEAEVVHVHIEREDTDGRQNHAKRQRQSTRKAR
jgi:hypothetical protein